VIVKSVTPLRAGGSKTPAILIWRMMSSGDDPRLENEWCGEEPHGDRYDPSSANFYRMIIVRRSRSKPEPVDEVSFTNHKNQVILPGDMVVYVTVGRHCVSVNTGRFIGVRKTTDWRNRVKTSVVLDADKEKSVPIDADGNECGYSDEWRKNGYKTKSVAYVGRVSLKRNRVYPVNVTLTVAFGSESALKA
jgi:hypothetical protein